MTRPAGRPVEGTTPDLLMELIMARMLTDQASQLRRLARRKLRSGMLVAVTSGKGGVGKTSIAVNLSVFLAAEGRRVVLVDLDLGLANADLLLNIQPRYTLSHVVSGVRTLTEIDVRGPAGLRMIPGASGVDLLANLSDFERRGLITQLQDLTVNADIVVLDCGAGISSNVIHFALSCDEAVVVTTPQPTAMTDAYATIKAIHREGGDLPIRLFVNMARNQDEAVATFSRVSGVAKRFLDFSVADGGYMLHDSKVELAVRQRSPFVLRYPDANASACVAAMAGRLTRKVGAPSSGGLLKRVAGLFL